MSRYLLYLHGFLSSPMAAKATCLRTYLAEKYPDYQLLTPQLACYPRPALLQIDEILTAYADQLVGVVGSSLGGLYGAYAASRSGLNAVMVNPVARLDKLAPLVIGEHCHPYTGERFRLSEHHVRELIDMQAAIKGIEQQCWLLLQTGDKTLDFRHALATYPNTRRTIECGGDHGFQGFHRYCPAIVEFLLNN